MAEATACSTERAPVATEWAWFAAWAGFGCLASLAATSLFIALAPALAAVAVAVAPRAIRRNAFGVLAGAASIPVLVAWSDRQGPGIVRWHTAMSSGWQTESDPKPWLAVGLIMIAVGIAGQLLLHRLVGRGSA